MLGIDFAVWLALMLSLASVVLCVGYGVTRWNRDDDPDREPGDRDPATAHGGGDIEKGREGL